jgi:hypothetical protein
MRFWNAHLFLDARTDLFSFGAVLLSPAKVL